jgi:hypothetical protein
MFNKCLAKAAGVTFVNGKCICPTNVDPVCSNGKIYNNTCLAIAAGVSYHVADNIRIVGIDRRPVCGSNGMVYDNMCYGNDVGITSFNRVEKCVCPFHNAGNYAPVCGTDRKTYWNKCFAQGDGVDFRNGKC